VTLTATPGVAEQDEFAERARLLHALVEHVQLEPVAAHSGRGRRGDEDGRVLGVQVLRVNVSHPTAGRNLLGESDRHDHVQAAWGGQRGSEGMLSWGPKSRSSPRNLNVDYLASL